MYFVFEEVRTCLDALGCKHDSLHARRTHFVDGGAYCGGRQASPQCCLPGWSLHIVTTSIAAACVIAGEKAKGSLRH